MPMNFKTAQPRDNFETKCKELLMNRMKEDEEMSL